MADELERSRKLREDSERSEAKKTLEKAKRPRDPNQLAKLIVDIASGETEDALSPKRAASVRGGSSGLKGGRSRAKRLTPAERADIARRAASARWKKKD